MKTVKSLIKTAIGRLITLTHPKLRAEVHAGDMGGPQRRLKRWISKTEFARLNARGDGTTVQQALTRRWTSGNTSVNYYDEYSERFDQMFSGAHGQIVDWLKAYADTGDVRHVIEVGCGDGRALAHMATRITEITKWTGVDINADIIARNQEAFAARDDLEFVAADAVDWLSEHAGPGTLLMTYGGVMEYIAAETLLQWFALVGERQGAGVLLVEPVDPGHDLETMSNSHIWGWENSYSHNHRALLAQADFRILESAKTTFMKYSWVMILAAPSTD